MPGSGRPRAQSTAEGVHGEQARNAKQNFGRRRLQLAAVALAEFGGDAATGVRAGAKRNTERRARELTLDRCRVRSAAPAAALGRRLLTAASDADAGDPGGEVTVSSDAELEVVESAALRRADAYLA